MGRVAQIGIIISALGIMIIIMGLFPGVTGLTPTPGIGIIQIFAILTGFTLLIMGALLYVKLAFYANYPSNLAQQIGTRLAFTGLVLAAMSGLADVLGFGSHGRNFVDNAFLGPWQATGIIGSYILSCIGVLIYAVTGNPNNNHKADHESEAEQS